MANSANPDQLASSEGIDLDLHCLQRRTYRGSAGLGLNMVKTEDKGTPCSHEKGSAIKAGFCLTVPRTKDKH